LKIVVGLCTNVSICLFLSFSIFIFSRGRRKNKVLQKLLIYNQTYLYLITDDQLKCETQTAFCQEAKLLVELTVISSSCKQQEAPLQPSL
jgi:hypothetical protein